MSFVFVSWVEFDTNASRSAPLYPKKWPQLSTYGC